MSNPNDAASVAHALYQATVKELSATHDPNLQREVMQALDDMFHTGEQNAAEITSALELTAEEKAALEGKLRAKFGRDLT